MSARQILAQYPAGGPRGSRKADEKADELTAQGQPATVVMDMVGDRFLVVPKEVR